MEARIILRARHEFDNIIEYFQKVKEQSNFSQEVLVGINAIQRAQKHAAPRDKLNRIPKSIKAARITRDKNTWSAISRTSYGPAVFTNEGTATHIGGTKYEIPNAFGQEGAIIKHPGIRGTHWWEAGAEIGAKVGFEAFRRKVGRILRSR